MEHASQEERFMLLGSDRVLYAGLLGTPTTRVLGAATLYVTLRGAVEVAIAGDAPRSGEVAFVPPYMPHRIRADDRSIACLLVEPETIDGSVLTSFVSRVACAADAARLASRVRDVCRQGHRVLDGSFTRDQFDELLFGAPLLKRRFDPRIASVLARFDAQPTRPISGEACARMVGVSLSRFLHLFKSQTEISFKTFRAWKRARTVLDHADCGTNLTRLALDIGYPDSTHFSHSIRRIYGLRPSAILSGSRRLRIVRNRAAPVTWQAAAAGA